MAGLLFAGLLYFRNRAIAELPKTALWTLSALRFLVITLITFLLLGPLIRYLDITVKPPIIAVVADNSTSLVLGGDSTANAGKITDLFAQIRQEIGGEYDVATYLLGDELTEGSELSFSEPITDISGAFNSLSDRYANRNLGAIILLSDGIYNRGSNPAYLNNSLNAPVYTLALGDTLIKRDARIAEAAANRIAFLGNSFPIEAIIEADKLKGETARFSISQAGAVLFSEDVTYSKESFSTTIRAVIEAKSPGLQRYTLSVTILEEESIVVNNQVTLFIEILDDRQEVLILGNSPHPDIKALREAVVSNENYQVEVALASQFDGDFSDHDLVILHQLPSNTADGRKIEKILKNSEVPVWAIVGNQTTMGGLSIFGVNYLTKGRSNSFNDVKGIANSSFSLFKVSDGINSLAQDAPPLQVPFGQWSVSKSSETLLYQKVGKIQTSDPLLVLQSLNNRKTAALLGEGIWRWRLADYARNESHELFDSFVSSIVQFLAVKEDKRLFRVFGPEMAMENESVLFRAELYNPSYESVNEPDVELVIRSEDGTEFPHFFSRTGEAYRLDAGRLPAGNYTYQASVIQNGQSLSDAGSFGVKPFALEGARLRADHRLLQRIAENSGGELFYPGEESNLISRIKGPEGGLKPVSYSNEIFSTILNFRWIFFILLLLLSGEWFFRKYLGRY